MVFLAFVALMYLFDALWEFVRVEHEFKKLAKFGWMCLGVTAGKLLVKAAVWAVNL
jgi:hypothetical protein